MKKLAILTLLAALLGTGFIPLARADWDAKLEAQEDAKRRAEQQAAARKRAEVDRMKKDAEAKAIRSYFGKEGNGKSDEELKRIYQQRQNDALRQAAAYGKAGVPPGKQDAATRAQHDQGMKSMYGKSLTEMERMSDKELDAFAKDMEKKYGK